MNDADSQAGGNMDRDECILCGQTATVHETSGRGLAAITRHFCLEHSDSIMPMFDYASRAFFSNATDEPYPYLPDSERERYARLYHLSQRRF
jgi:hypothetical protein